MELVLDTIERYRRLYGSEPSVVATAPGRVNLIGEHTDYNDGFVLPVSIDRTIAIAAGPRSDNMLYLHTADLQASVSVSLADLRFEADALWTNYPKGVAHTLQTQGYRLRGANFCIRGNIPIGAGLSSSAALEVASALVFRDLNDIPLSNLRLIQVACQSEHEFVSVHCGIMDQFVSVMGRKDHALFLDCRSLDFSYVPIPAGVRLVICDTGVRRELALSAYNQRRAECEEAVREIEKQIPGVRSLREIGLEKFRTLEKSLSPVSRKRALHVISENDRVTKSVEAMQSNDLSALGTLMIQSHISLCDNYEVSSRELNAFVDIATAADGVYGARMTGAGFGGSVICLVDEKKVDGLVHRIRQEYPRIAGRSLTVYLTFPGDGAAIIHPAQSLTPVPVAQTS